MKASPGIGKLAEALSKAQLEIGGAELDAKNSHFGSAYSTLGSVMKACKPALSKHGLVVSQFIETDAEGTFVETVLMHSSGEWISGSVKLIIEKQTMQGLGSAITYAKRYALAAIAGVVDEEDDDANAATASAPQPRQASTGPSPVKPLPVQETPLVTLARIVKEKGLATETQAFCQQAYGISDSTKLSAKQIGEVINFINKGVIKPGFDPGFDRQENDPRMVK